MSREFQAHLDVKSRKGRIVAQQKTYYPVSPAVVYSGFSLPFNLYLHQRAGQLELIVGEGMMVPKNLMGNLQKSGMEGRLYVRGDQRSALVEYQKDVLSEMLEDDDVSVDVKCHVLQNQTELISQELFEQPTALHIENQRHNIKGMVDLVMREPAAMRGLLGLTHYDYETYTHSVNVGLYGLWMLTKLYEDRSDEDLHEIATAFFLHDIGKSAIDSAIINKPGRLTDGEWMEVRKHPMYGYRILQKENNLTKETSLVVFQHHERMDGMGYPKGLESEEIHPYARICSVADAFDALTTRRSYKPALTHFEALRMMKEEMHVQFDQEVFKTLVLLCQKRGDQ